MKFLKQNIWVLLFVVFIILWIIFIPKCKPDPKETTTTITIHDTIPGDKDTVYKPVVINRPDTFWTDPDTVQIEFDSSLIEKYKAISELYNRHNVYSITLQDDSSAFIQVKDTLYKNKLAGRSYGFQNRRLTAINTQITTTIVNNGNGVFVGGGFVGSNPGGEFSVVKDRWMFDGGYYDKQIKVSVKYRLFKLK